MHKHELSSLLLKIPNDAYILLRQLLIGCSLLSQEYCEPFGRYWKMMSRQLYTLIYQNITDEINTSVHRAEAYIYEDKL